MNGNGNGNENRNYRDTEDALELELAREVRQLRREVQPARDLWPGIERRILDHPHRQRRWTSVLMPLGVAASLLVAVTSLVMVISLKENAGTMTPVNSLDAMDAEYSRVRNPMVEQFSQTNSSLDPQTMEDLYRNIAIMEQAKREIEAQLRENPDNRRLLEMLMKVQEQELELLRQDYTYAGRSM